MNHTMKNSTLTYHEIYGQPDSFQAILDTLPEIEATLDEVFSEKYDQLIFTGQRDKPVSRADFRLSMEGYEQHAGRGGTLRRALFFPENYIKGKKTLVLPITRKSYTTEVRKAIDRVHESAGSNESCDHLR